MKTRNPFIGAIIVFVLFIISTGQSRADFGSRFVTVYAIGNSAVYHQNVAAAREVAITNALVTALHQAVMYEILTKSMIQQFNIMNELILSNYNAFINDYKVLAEGKHQGAYRVLITAHITKEKLHSTIINSELSPENMNKPVVLTFVAAKEMGDTDYSFWWGDVTAGVYLDVERGISEVVADNGGKTIELQQNQIEKVLPNRINNYKISNKDAIKIGQQLGADILIIGVSEVENAMNGSNSNSLSIGAKVSLRAIETRKGQQIASVNKVEPLRDENDTMGALNALVRVAKSASQELIFNVMAQWNNIAALPRSIEIFIQGTGKYSDFSIFRQQLSKMQGVNNVFPKEMSALQQQLIITYSGEVKSLVDNMVSQQYRNFTVSISEVSAYRLKLELIPD